MSDEVMASYLSKVDTGHRQRYGQFFTPSSLAGFMSRWVLETGAKEVFDPAFGLGAFFFAARAINSQVIFRGIEKDEKILSHFRTNHTCHNGTGLELINSDYLTIWGGKHTAIICNPPYMRFQNFKERQLIIPEIERQTGLRLSGYTNIASAFLFKSLSELAPGGRLAYLMPLEFLNTGYGETIKRALLHRGRLKALLRVEPEGDVFPDAITSVGIILVSDDGHKEPVKFYTIRSLDQMDLTLSGLPCRAVLQADLRPCDKWLCYFDESQSINHPALQPLSLYGFFSRGIATGANEFFVLSRAEAVARALPSTILRPCISRSSQVTCTLLTDADVQHLVQSDKRVLLVDLVSSNDESGRRYIAYGESQGFNLRYLTRKRRPWFKLESRSPAPILIGVFSRDGFKVIRNMSSALSLTCFHCFYPNLFGAKFVDHLFLYFSSSAGKKVISKEVRKYGNNLEKFEPHDLNNALVPSPQWFSNIPEDLVKSAIAHVERSGLPFELSRLFDELLV